MISCSETSKTDNSAATKPATQKEATKTASAGVNNEIKPLLQRLLPQVEKVEYVFYKQGMSFSTETSGQQAVLSYYNFVSDQAVAKHSCKYDGGAVFRSPEGDIVLTADFVIVDQKCKSFVVTAEGKTYYQQMDDSGLKYLMNFYNIDMNSGQMKPK